MPTGGKELSLLPKEPIESFWDALWLGIRPFLCFCALRRQKTFEGFRKPPVRIDSFRVLCSPRGADYGGASIACLMFL